MMNDLSMCAPQVPDVYGVFKYVLEYHHAGYSYINLSQQVSRVLFLQLETDLTCGLPSQCH